MKFWTIPAEVARILVPNPSPDAPPLLLYTDKVLSNGQPIFRSWHPLEGFGSIVPDSLIVFPASEAYFTAALQALVDFEVIGVDAETFARLAAEWVDLPVDHFNVKSIEVTLASDEEEG